LQYFNATAAIEGLNSALSSAEKQSIAIEIGRLFIVDAKGVDSLEMNDYNILTVPMIINRIFKQNAFIY
jgi:hypothetical protein